MEEPKALVVTADDVELVKRTVAQGATDAELKLYLFDCKRQGVHPLDKLLHFTKRGGKYTPVTSIDLMRIRAADTNAYAGNEDARFVGNNVSHPDEATVTVWRLVEGTRCPFTATARWSEYYPGDQAGAMWKKMPHTMLAKCAEALALRKGFPRQLSGLYASEELDQATRSEPVAISAGSVVDETQNAYMPAGLDASDLPAGQYYMEKVAPGMGTAKAFVWYLGQDGQDGRAQYKLSFQKLKEWCEDGVPVKFDKKTSAAGKPYLENIEPAVIQAAKPATSLLDVGDPQL
jgi:phage recombination protein Bet